MAWFLQIVLIDGLVIALCFTNVVSQYLQYVGCFEDNPISRVLPGKMKVFPSQLYNNNHPNTCGEFCRKNKFIFAGLENVHECWCGNNEPQIRVSDTKCNYLCVFANALPCGGYLKISVYRTGISSDGIKVFLIQTRPQLEYVGCFKHSKELLKSIWSEPEVEMKAHQIRRKAKVTPATCSRECRSNGFILSGVTRGKECLCSHDVHENAQRLGENSCTETCIADGFLICGGKEEGIISVYNQTGPQI